MAIEGGIELDGVAVLGVDEGLAEGARTVVVGVGDDGGAGGSRVIGGQGGEESRAEEDESRNDGSENANGYAHERFLTNERAGRQGKSLNRYRVEGLKRWDIFVLVLVLVLVLVVVVVVVVVGASYFIKTLVII